MAPPDTAFLIFARHTGNASPHRGLPVPPREYRWAVVCVLIAEKSFPSCGIDTKEFLRPPAAPGFVREGGLHLVAPDGVPDGPCGIARLYVFCASAQAAQPVGAYPVSSLMQTAVMRRFDHLV